MGSQVDFQEPLSPYQRCQFGKDVAKEFLFDPDYRNLNHGSFGAIPRAVQALQRTYQDMAEARVDQFIRYDWVPILDESRAAVAQLLGVEPETVVFVNNATTGVNTVLRNLVWDGDKRDEILYFNTIYGACVRTVDFVVETSRDFVSSRCVELDYPCEDEEVVSRFKAAVDQSRAEGKRPRVAIIDVVSSLPGIRVPFEALVRLCREDRILSLVDGAQGIGMVDLTHVGPDVDPDFFVTNCHKWLHSPRGCAAFYVPLRNQPLMRSTLPTSHGFIPRPKETGGPSGRLNPIAGANPSEFINNFQFVGTLDNAPYMCVRDSIRWRQEVLGGEEAIREYVTKLAKEGGAKVAEILGTEVMENTKGTLTSCGMVNVALPVGVANGPQEAEALALQYPALRGVVSEEHAAAAAAWLERTLVREYKTFLPIYVYKGRWWTRLSAQVYLDLDDFEWAGKVLLALSDKIGLGEQIELLGKMKL